MKLAAIVITYYPDVCDAIKNIGQYIEYVDKILIWENTPQIDREKHKITIPGYKDKIIYMSTGKNEGISYPLNRAVEYSITNNYTHLLTMDQDSFFINFETYKSTICKNIDKLNIGIFSPNVNNKSKSTKEIEEVPEAITSGTIYNIDIFSNGLAFREDFFIDMVDNEFCYNAYSRNIHTVVLPACHLKQCFGNTTRYAIGIYSLNYSAFRIYHLVRNFIVTWMDYPNLIQHKRDFITKSIFNRSLKIIFLEKHKKSKLLAMYWGIKDGLSRTMVERNFVNK